MAMTAANGTLTPPTLPAAPTSPSPAKRKRTDTDANLPNGAPKTAPAQLTNGASRSLQTLLNDLLSVLKSYDTQPSILTHPITSTSSRAASGEADAKRTKLTPPSGSTITSLIQYGSYDSLEALEKDVESATDDILAGISYNELSAVQPSLEDRTLHAKVLAFHKIFRTLITREGARKTQVNEKQTESDDAAEREDSVVEEEPESRTVLTVFGSAQGPKQLFSSLQQPRLVSSGQPSILDSSAKIILPLRESSLPNIISTTEVFPLPDDVDDKKKENDTIGKLFKAPANIPQLSPPKLAKPLSTKGNTVTFAPPEVPKPHRKSSHSFANQNLSAGYWLGYGGVDMPKDPTSPTAKQKSRQRALSMGEAQQPPTGLTLAAVKHAKEDALFRSAYSSFAPTRDNASAVIPEETKNMVWWQKVGEKRFNEVFPIDPALLGLEDSPIESTNETGEDDINVFREAADKFEPIEGGPFPEPEQRSELDKGTDEILEEISELLETLASHQRIRNSSLATNPRTPVIQNSSLASLAGSPSTPSTEEIDVYSMLKSQLTLMISQLPPYAVAKLNGDQLEDLNISRTILVENKYVDGVLEEDQYSRAAKQPTAAVAATPSLSRMASGTTSQTHYPATSTQYTRPASALQSGARPVQPSTSYYPQQQSAHRSPSVTYPRTNSGTSQGYQAPAGSFTVPPRQTYSTGQAYQTPRASYGPGSTGYFSQRPTQATTYGGASASQYYGSTPQTQPPTRYVSQPASNGYYQRPQNVAPMYGATPSTQARTASPLKAAPAAAPQSYAARPGYGTPVSGGQLRSTYYPPSQYGNAQPHTPVAPVTPGFSANTQQMMMSREQAQAAQQPQARLAAQNSFTRQGSGTPQPPPSGGGQYGGQANGASMVT